MFDWLKSRAALVAELREAREQAALYAGDRARLVAKVRSGDEAQVAARRERDAARDSLETVIRQRDAAWARIREFHEQAAAVDAVGQLDPLDSPAPRTASAALLAERARADQLAERLTLLQEANMRAGCAHGVPLVETGSRV